MKGKLIVFEGLDCSFKETTSNNVYKALQKVKGLKVIKFDFPNYGKESAFFVENLLKGDYKSANLDFVAKTSLFMVDIFHTWISDIKKYYDEGYIVILDRYWFSNLYYQNYAMENYTSVDEIKFDYKFDKIVNMAKGYDLPKPNITFFMDMSLEVMEYLLSKKKNKDINELNTSYLENVHSAYHFVLNHRLKSKTDVFGKAYMIKCEDEDGTIRHRDDLCAESRDFILNYLEGNK